MSCTPIDKDSEGRYVMDAPTCDDCSGCRVMVDHIGMSSIPVMDSPADLLDALESTTRMLKAGRTPDQIVMAKPRKHRAPVPETFVHIGNHAFLPKSITPGKVINNLIQHRRY